MARQSDGAHQYPQGKHHHKNGRKACHKFPINDCIPVMGCDVRRFSVPSERSLFTQSKPKTIPASGPKKARKVEMEGMDFPPSGKQR